MGKRYEFSQKVRKAALERAGDRCEAVGQRYGHVPGTRCTAILSRVRVELDHYPLGAHAEGSNTLENCVVCCRDCNQYAANHTDKAVEAKIKRIRRARGPVELRKVRLAIPARMGGYSKGRPLAGTKASGLRKRMNGQVERW